MVGKQIKVVGVVPFKFESRRLPQKNFKPISNKKDAPPLWKATYQIMKNDPRISEVYLAIDDNPDTLSNVREHGVTNNIFQENVDYPQGNTLGQKLSYFIMFLGLNEMLKDVDYVIVAQVDTWPKFTSDVSDMFEAAKEMNCDYIVSGHDGKQHGAWRMIKVPLTQEVLGQTIGVCEMGMERIEVHTQKELEAVQFFYDNSEGEF